MSKPDLTGIDPKTIYIHARGFFTVGQMFGNMDSSDPALLADIGAPVIVLSSLNSELFLKCIVCIETGLTPQGHHLDYLYGRLSADTRTKVEHIWDTQIAPHREAMWSKIEASIGATFPRKLPVGIVASRLAFEKIRYSYEKNQRDNAFSINDLPWVLNRVILQMRPEWQGLQRPVTELTGALLPRK